MYWRSAEDSGERVEEVSGREAPPSDLRVLRPRHRRTLIEFVDLVWTKARLNLKSEANRNYLSYAWWLIEPLAYMTVFYLIFGMLLQRGEEGYIAYLLTGLVPFQWFAKTVSYTAGSIVAGRGLMHKVRVSPLFFPLVGVVQNLGKQFSVFAMLFLFLILYGLPPTIHWLAIIPVVVVQFLLITVVSCLVAMVIPFLRDLHNLVPTGIQFIMFASGIFYSVDRIPEQWKTLFFLNPMANLLHQYRQVFLEASWPDWTALFYLTVSTIALFLLTLYLYKLLEDKFARVVLE